MVLNVLFNGNMGEKKNLDATVLLVEWLPRPWNVECVHAVTVATVKAWLD